MLKPFPFRFFAGPWENSELPTIVRSDPAGGDPHILATIKRIHNPAALHELCGLANSQIAVTRPCSVCGEDADEPCAYRHCGRLAVAHG